MEADSSDDSMAALSTSQPMSEKSKSRFPVRERKSTTLIIDGHTVLARNAYEVKGVGGYIFMDTPEASSSSSSSKKNTKKTPAKAAGSAKKPRAKPAAQVLREKTNTEIDAMREVLRGQRNRFFAQNLAVVKQFCSARAGKELAAVAAEGKPPTRGADVFCQPETVTGGEMRDYQLDGLDFLVKMFDKGVNCILGDEMGLGKTLQTIATIAYLKFERKLSGPSLVISPL